MQRSLIGRRHRILSGGPDSSLQKNSRSDTGENPDMYVSLKKNRIRPPEKSPILHWRKSGSVCEFKKNQIPASRKIPDTIWRKSGFVCESKKKPDHAPPEKPYKIQRNLHCNMRTIQGLES